jgi:preprotein translocase subunit SecY
VDPLLTVLLGALQSIGIAFMLTKQGLVLNPGPLHLDDGADADHRHGLHHVAGRADYRSRHRQRHEPADLRRHRRRPAARRGDLVQKVQTNAWGSFTIVAVLLLVAGMFAVVAFIVFVERSERRIPIQSARRIVGRRMMGGQSSHLPLKVNSGGVMPVIFASSILSAPMLFSQVEWVQNSRFLQPIVQALQPGYPWYELLYVLGIIFFAYFYVSIIMKPDDIADNFRKSGSFIPGIRPGKRTSDFINDILTRITLVGALYLIVISLVPTFLISGIRFDKIWLIGRVFENLPTWMTHGMGVNFYFGGTSLLIVVGVAMDTVNQIESQLIMRHYDGFSPRSGRIRGRKTW